jgi:IclR family acetate operon transcriptional repressor
MRVLDFVVNCADTQGASGAEIASALELERTTTHRLLKTLAKGGLVHQTQFLRYVPGPALMRYGLVITRRAGWIHAVRPILEELTEKTKETAAFTLLLPNGERIFVDQVESPRTVRWIAPLGLPIPLYAGASGKSILAAMSPKELDQFLANTQLKPITPATIVDPNKLRVELQKIRERGYATSIAERSLDSAVVSSAIITKAAGVIGAISVSGPMSRVKPSLFPKYGALVKEAALRVSELLDSDFG